jgi:hypothetical protein
MSAKTLSVVPDSRCLRFFDGTLTLARLSVAVDDVGAESGWLPDSRAGSTSMCAEDEEDCQSSPANLKNSLHLPFFTPTYSSSRPSNVN